MIGWEDDHNTVGPVAAAAKQSLLRLIPHIIPTGDESIFYRFVIDHGDFGIHNMSIAMDANNQPLTTSLYDWETGCIVPAILSDPLMKVTVDLVTTEDALPALTRLPRTVTADETEQMATWSRLYHEVRSPLIYSHLTVESVYPPVVSTLTSIRIPLPGGCSFHAQ